MDSMASPAFGGKVYPILVASDAPDNCVQIAADGSITIPGEVNAVGGLRVGGVPVATSTHAHGTIGNDGKITTNAPGHVGAIELAYTAPNDLARRLVLPDPGVAEAVLLTDRSTIDGDVW